MGDITLNYLGETLKPNKDQNEDAILIGTIGTHSCGGFMEIKVISTTHKAIICRSCCLRITIPHAVKNYTQLRDHLIF